MLKWNVMLYYIYDKTVRNIKKKEKLRLQFSTLLGETVDYLFDRNNTLSVEDIQKIRFFFANTSNISKLLVFKFDSFWTREHTCTWVSSLVTTPLMSGVNSKIFLVGSKKKKHTHTRAYLVDIPIWYTIWRVVSYILYLCVFYWWRTVNIYTIVSIALPPPRIDALVRPRLIYNIV